MNINKIKEEKKVESAESIVIPNMKLNNEEQLKTRDKKQQWQEATKKQQEFVANPVPVKLVKLQYNDILLPKRRVPGYTASGNIIIETTNRIKEQEAVEYKISPHCVVAMHDSVKDTVGVEVMQHVMLRPDAVASGEIQIGGVGFFIFDASSVLLGIPDLNKWMDQNSF